MRFLLAKSAIGLGLVLVVLSTARATPASETLPRNSGPSARPPTTGPNDPLRETNLFPHEDTLCGPFALYLACRSYGITRYSAMDLARMAEFNGRSTSIDGLRQACDRIGLHALAAQVNAPALEKLVRGGRARAVVLLRGGHFCYVDQADGGRFRITNYPFGPRWYDAGALVQAWDGPTLLLSRDPLPDLATVGAPEMALARTWNTGRTVGLGLAITALSYLGYINFKGRRSSRAAPPEERS